MGIKEKWLESLPEQFRGQPNIEVIIGSWAKQLEEVEAVLAELPAKRGVCPVADTCLVSLCDIQKGKL